MDSRPQPLARPRRHRHRAVVTGLVAAVVATLAVPLSALPAHAEDGSAETVSDLTLIQANIKTTMTPERFQADAAEVLAQQPDFVTYNEVPFRYDTFLAPEGYDLHRNTRNRFTAATPVAWRTDRWTEVDHGTFMISNWRGKPPGRVVELGRRFANWVTLRSNDGRQLSVVSVHFAPKVKGMPFLLRPSAERLNILVEQLAPKGPVLVGGDFNVHYRSKLYARDLFEAGQLEPTYDTLGNWFPTGDHRGATIDYIFNRGGGQLVAEQHRAFELFSDHDAVVGGFDWTVDAPTDTEYVRTDPATALRSAAMRRVVGEINTAGPGARIDLVTAGVVLRPVVRSLKRAAARGVTVRLTTRSRRLTVPERRIRRFFRRGEGRDGEVRLCGSDCRQAIRSGGIPRTALLVHDATGAATTRVDANRFLNASMLERVTTVATRTGEEALTEGQEWFRAIG